MENSYKKYFEHDRYTLVEVMYQFQKVKDVFDDVKFVCHRGKFCICLTLRPTDFSPKYNVELRGKIGSTIIQVFVTNPIVRRKYNGKLVPHMYADGSLCLYYPKYRERNVTDMWAATLVPWTSLWLYYYELWQQTGEWLGGGIHGSDRGAAA